MPRVPPALRRPLVAVPAAFAVVTLAGVGASAALGDANSTTDATPSATSSATTAETSAGQSQDSHAIVVNHGDNRYRYAIALRIVHVDSSVVDPQNVAVAAAANCTDCTTVAISMEGVLVYGDPTVFAPTNLALAYNEDCTNCQTLAAAFQQIVPTDGMVRITGTGRQEIAAVRQDLEAIRHDDLTLDEIDARVDADAGRLLAVLRDDVVPIGNAPDISAPNAATSSSTPPSPDPSSGAATTDTPSPAPSDTTSPSGTPTDSPSDSPSTGSSPGGSASASASGSANG